ncbi:MAG: hypothetical protein O9327_02170 [Polaromonas sp.]|nr:hypothetical protein [Polaromonas sp.]
MPQCTTPLTLQRSGFENPVHIMRGRNTVAIVFSDQEGGDQYDTAPVMAAAAVMREALIQIKRLAGQQATAEAAIADGALAEIERLGNLASN